VKTKCYLVALSVSLFYGGLAFIVTWNYLLGLAVFAFYVLAASICVIPSFIRYGEKEKKRHEAYRFVNSFLITLSVTKSPEKAYEGAISGAEGELALVAKSIAGYTVEEKIEYLKNYFLEPYFPMFVSVFRLYEEQGGDPLTLGEPLLKEATRSETSDNAKAKESLSQLVEFLSLWIMSALIIVFVRVCLRTFYSQLVNNWLYLGCALAYFFLALVSFVYYSSVYTEMPLILGRDQHVQSLMRKDEE
jgi:hypothetical protein